MGREISGLSGIYFWSKLCSECGEQRWEALHSPRTVWYHLLYIHPMCGLVLSGSRLGQGRLAMTTAHLFFPSFVLCLFLFLGTGKQFNSVLSLLSVLGDISSSWLSEAARRMTQCSRNLIPKVVFHCRVLSSWLFPGKMIFTVLAECVFLPVVWHCYCFTVTAVGQTAWTVSDLRVATVQFVLLKKDPFWLTKLWCKACSNRLTGLRYTLPFSHNTPASAFPSVLKVVYWVDSTGMPNLISLTLSFCSCLLFSSPCIYKLAVTASCLMLFLRDQTCDAPLFPSTKGLFAYPGLCSWMLLE